MFSAGSEIDGRKLRFLLPPSETLPIAFAVAVLRAFRSIGRDIVATVLTRLAFAFGSGYCRFRGKIAPWIVGSPTDNRAQLTHW